MLKLKPLRNEKGIATIELIPIMVIIVLLVNFALGFFGVIQTAIVNQIAARNYAFETFRHRPNLVYFKDKAEGKNTEYSKQNLRIHATVSSNGPANTFVATERPIDFLKKQDAVGSPAQHNKEIYNVVEGKRYNNTDGANPVWVRPQYGICLNSKCGQGN